jgi:putative ABC transport system substrate-binding protein
MIRRRGFIAGLGSAAAWPVVARAQQAERMRRIGVLSGRAEGDPEAQARHAAFRLGLERLGWSEGRNVHIDYRFAAASPVRFQAFAKELLALQPDVIFADTTPAASALQRESRVVPIVFVGVSDPIGSGFVASLARPGGNLTGFLLVEASIAGKWLAMLKEIEPHLTRAAFMANPKTTPYDYFLRAAEALAPALAIELVPLRVETAADHERAF